VRQTIAVNGLTAASEVAVSPQGDTLYVTEPGTNQVAVFKISATGSVHSATVGLRLAQHVAGAMAINAAGTKAIPRRR